MVQVTLPHPDPSVQESIEAFQQSMEDLQQSMADLRQSITDFQQLIRDRRLQYQGTIARFEPIEASLDRREDPTPTKCKRSAAGVESIGAKMLSNQLTPSTTPSERLITLDVVALLVAVLVVGNVVFGVIAL
ncbi:hypothetical protein GGR51DRAFT_565675 [Nemania sp. FL0031]|nr:hypothetical protein GGR51DRAFT_565675 [Nemania sp. FL0031]